MDEMVIFASNKRTMKNLSFLEKERLCELAFEENAPYWHIATPGQSTEILFTNEADYRFGMSLMAESAYLCNIRIFSFELMSNHLHNVATARCKQNCIDCLDHFQRRLKRVAKLAGRDLDLSGFVCEPILIDSLPSLRNNMVYVDRNAYVVNADHTPYSYPWGSGHLYFGSNPTLLSLRPINELTIREKRELFKTRDPQYPDYFKVKDGYIAPESFVDWRTGRTFFRDAHQYFNMLIKNYEAYAEFAKILGDKTILTDEEMYSTISSLAYKNYHLSRLGDLNDRQRIELAKRMHFDFCANNSQIRRVLKLDPGLLQELFPVAK